jgi:hypothetical protein
MSSIPEEEKGNKRKVLIVFIVIILDEGCIECPIPASSVSNGWAGSPAVKVDAAVQQNLHAEVFFSADFRGFTTASALFSVEYRVPGGTGTHVRGTGGRGIRVGYWRTMKLPLSLDA